MGHRQAQDWLVTPQPRTCCFRIKSKPRGWSVSSCVSPLSSCNLPWRALSAQPRGRPRPRPLFLLSLLLGMFFRVSHACDPLWLGLTGFQKPSLLSPSPLPRGWITPPTHTPTWPHCPTLLSPVTPCLCPHMSPLEGWDVAALWLKTTCMHARAGTHTHTHTHTHRLSLSSGRPQAGRSDT